jgi:hypothetical protein
MLQERGFVLAALILSSLLAVACAAGARYTSFRPGQQWLDTEGNEIRAHSGGLLYVPTAAKHYWYGSDGYPNGDATLNRQINVYESDGNLYNFKNMGVAFTMPLLSKCQGAASPNITKPASCYADRCKVLQHPKGYFVMWCKSKPFVSVSTSTSPTGTMFKFKLL